MMSLLNKCDIDYKSLQDTVLPLWLDKYIEVGIEKREDVNCYTYKNIKKFELFYQDYTGNYCCPVNNSFPLYWFVYQRFIAIFTKWISTTKQVFFNTQRENNTNMHLY